MNRKIIFSGAIAAFGLVLAAGCAERTHLTASYGRAYHLAFAGQVANPKTLETPKSAKTGLDSQEAAIVAKTYRAGLAGKGTGTPENQPMLLMSPQHSQGTGPYMPPPSVPDKH